MFFILLCILLFFLYIYVPTDKLMAIIVILLLQVHHISKLEKKLQALEKPQITVHHCCLKFPPPSCSACTQTLANCNYMENKEELQ